MIDWWSTNVLCITTRVFGAYYFWSKVKDGMVRSGSQRRGILDERVRYVTTKKDNAMPEGGSVQEY